MRDFAAADFGRNSSIERLREKAGVNRRLLEEPSCLLPLPLAPVQATAEALLGAVPALFGFLSGAIPYYLTKQVARRCILPTGHPPALSFTHILVGAIVFPVAYGFELTWVWRHFSDATTIAFAALLIPTGLFARFYGWRMRKLAVHVGGRAAYCSVTCRNTRIRFPPRNFRILCSE